MKGHCQFRFGFLNCNGIQLLAVGLANFIQSSKEFQVDCFGVAETHMDTTKLHVRNSFLEAATSHNGNSNVHCTFAQSDNNFGTDYKRGRVLQLSVYNVANRVMDLTFDKYGRYVSQTIVGCNGKKATVISAYRVVEGLPGPASAYSQQWAMLVTKGRPANPRGIFLLDMVEYVLAAQNKGHSIILGLDANESWERKPQVLERLL